MTIPLFEAGLYSYLSTRQSGVALFRQTRHKFPNTFVIPVHAKSLIEANEFVVVRTNVNKLDAERKGDDNLKKLATKLEVHNPFAFLHFMEKYPSIFKVFRIEGRDRLYKFLTTDLNMNPDTWDSFMGDIPDISEENYTPFHNAKVFFSDTIKKPSLNASMKALEQVFKLLTNAGIGYVFGTTIRMHDSKNKDFATYFLQSDEIRVNPRAKNIPEMVWATLHEFTHRLHDIYFSPEQKQAVKDKYYELRSAGASHKDTQIEDILARAKEIFQPGLVVDYVGRDRGLKRYGPQYQITKVVGDTAHLKSVSAPQFAQFRVNIDALLLKPNIYSVRGLDLGIRKKLLGYERETDQWFPTPYSMKDHEEWLSELLSLTLMGKIQGEPAEWVRNFIA